VADAIELSLFDVPPADALAARLRALGLRDVTGIVTHRNRTTLVSVTSRGVLRLHEEYAGAPESVLRAIVRFVARRVTRAERRAALRELLAWPITAPPREPRVPDPARLSVRDARMLERLRARWHEHNAAHFGAALTEIPIHLSGRLRRRLGQLNYCSRTGRALEIVMSRRFTHRQPWAEVDETLLHEMVHQWQAQTGRRVDHGEEFRRKAREVGITPRAVAVPDPARAARLAPESGAPSTGTACARRIAILGR
jgi:hypothetical protein